MKFVQVHNIGLDGGGEVVIRVDSEVGVIALIGEEGGYTSGSTRCIVVGEFCKRKEFQPIVLLVVAVISLNLTKSNPNLGLPQSTLDHSDYSVHPRSHLGLLGLPLIPQLWSHLRPLGSFRPFSHSD